MHNFDRMIILLFFLLIHFVLCVYQQKCHDVSLHGQDGLLQSTPCLLFETIWSQTTVGARHRRLIRSLPRSTGLGERTGDMIVIANCHEDLKWTEELKHIPLAIYQKCHQFGNIKTPKPLKLLDPKLYGRNNIYETYLNNTGEECSAYLQFIVSNYDHLPDTTFFLQGSPLKHQPYLHWIVKHLRRDLDFVSISNLYVGYNLSLIHI